MMNLKDLIQEELKDPEFKRAYDALDEDIAFQMSLLVEDVRVSRGLTQARFAKKLKMQQPAIARIERGTSTPTLAFLKRIADAFNLRLVLPRFEPKEGNAIVNTIERTVRGYRNPPFSNYYGGSYAIRPALSATLSGNYSTQPLCNI